MTIIVWDGQTLATDCAATDGDALWKTIKAWPWKGEILSGVGSLPAILAMREWYKHGAVVTAFPPIQLTPQFCHFLVVTQTGLLRYEQGIIPIEHGAEPCAFGEGRDFALGALAMGATAEQAAIVANQHSPNCGMGVKLYKLGEE